PGTCRISLSPMKPFLETSCTDCLCTSMWALCRASPFVRPLSDLSGDASHRFAAGDLFLEAFNLNPNDYWMNVGVLAGQGVVYLVIACLLLHHYVKWRQ